MIIIFDNLIFNNDGVYVIPPQDKPIKICFEDYLCPMNSSVRCEYSKVDSKGMDFIIKCRNYNKEGCKLNKKR